MTHARPCAPNPGPLTDIVTGVNSVADPGPEAPRVPGARLVRAGAIAFLAVVASWVIYALLSGRNGALDPVDLTVYRDGGLIVRQVRPYYDPHATAPLYDWGGYSSLALKFTYTPFAAIAFALFSYIPWTPLWVLSIIVNIAALLAALWFTFGGLGYADRRVRLGATLVAAAVVFWLQPVVRTIYLGQINLILMAAIIWDLCQPDNSKGRPRWWKGAMTGVAAGIKLVPLIFVPYLLITKKFREAAMTVAGFLATVGVGFVILPSDSARWWLHGMFLANGNRTGFMGWSGNQSLRAIITRLTGSVAAGQGPWIAAAAVTFVLGMTAAALLERKGYHLPAILATALTGLLVSPVSWDHHWVWVAPGVVVAWHYAIRCWRTARTSAQRWQARGLAALAAGLIVVFAAWPDALWESQRNLGRFSLGLLWAQPNTTPILFSKYGDLPRYVEYHWHGFQLLWGNAYIIAGTALLLILLALAVRLRPVRPAPGQDTGPQATQQATPTWSMGH
jgi:alpha-1,2-mannosyltransferase